MPDTKEKRRVIIELGPNTLLALLQIPLICLKLTNLIQFPWWMVLLPWWGMFALGLILVILSGIMWLVKNTFYFTKR
jgi:hypothetical protein